MSDVPPAQTAPITPATMQALREHLAREDERWRDQSTAWLEQVADSLTAPIRQWIDDLTKSVYPSNWQGLSNKDRIAAVELMSRTGVCLMWAPRAEVVAMVLRASDAAARSAVLVDRTDDVLNDAEAAISIELHPDIRDQASVALEALRAHRAGFPRAAQALAAAGLSGALVDHFGWSNFTDARLHLGKHDPMQGTVRRMRMAAVLRCLVASIQVTHDAPSGTFNRHATTHGVDVEQYTAGNAVAALLLHVGLVREVHEWFTREDQSSPVTP